MGEPNGFFDCPISGTWTEHRREIKEMRADISTAAQHMTAFSQHLSHLTKLDCLERIENKLINAATEKESVDPKTLFLIIKIFAIVIISLVFCIVFLLVGENVGLIKGLYH